MMGFGLNWMGPNANVQDVKIYRAPAKSPWEKNPSVGGRAVYSHTLENVAIGPRTTASRQDGSGLQRNEVTGKSLYIDDTQDIESTDKVEIKDARGRISYWAVDGDVDTDYANPLSSFSPGREIQIKKIGGL